LASTLALTSGGLIRLPFTSMCASPLGAATIRYGSRSRSSFVSS